MWLETGHDAASPSMASRAMFGHPRCTNAEDCIGMPEDRLVRHLMGDGGWPGGLYCDCCWKSCLDNRVTASWRWEPDAAQSWLDKGLNEEREEKEREEREVIQMPRPTSSPFS